MSQQLDDITNFDRYYYTSDFSIPTGSNKLLNYYSIKHLYYSNFNTGSGLIEQSGSFENYIQSSFGYSGSRTLDSTGEGIAISIPKSLYGVYVEPSSILISSSFSYGSFPSGLVITDDGEGNLIQNGNRVGNAIYSHGQLIVTSFNHYQFLSASEAAGTGSRIDFKSNNPIYTYTYNIKISDYEFNHTLNPTAQSGSTVLDYSGSKYGQPSGMYADNVTGSVFQPYITTVGLYNDSDQLIAVGKLAQPLPKPADTELTIQIKLDV